MVSLQLRRYRGFVRGPIPDGWLKKAGAISSTAFAVGVILWKLSYQKQLWGVNGLAPCSGKIRLSNKMCEPYGINRAAKLNALDKLHRARLVSLTKEKGASPDVVIIDDFLIQPE